MNFQPKEFCYNPKTKVFSEIGGSSSLANQIASNPSILGYTKNTLVEALIEGYKKSSSPSQKDRSEIEEFIEEIEKNKQGKYPLIIDALMYYGIFQCITAKIGGKNTLILKTLKNLPQKEWKEILREVFINIDFSQEIEKTHLVGLTSTNTTTILHNKLEILYFLETGEIKLENSVIDHATSTTKNLFNRSYSFFYAGTKNLSKDKRQKEFTYNFNLPSGGGNVLVIFTHDFDTKSVDVVFSRRNTSSNKTRVDVTGEGDAIKILSTVMAVMDHFCKKFQPKYITFQAEISRENSSRGRVYEKMVKRYAETFGYKMTSITFKTYEANFSLEKK